MKGKILTLTIMIVMVLGSFGAIGVNTNNNVSSDCVCENDNSIFTNEEIQAIENEIIENNWSFTVGFNSATTRSINSLCGLKEPENWQDDANFDFCVTKNSLPDEFDWSKSDKNYVGRDCTTPIKDQKNCGSCWAFATVALLESKILIKENSEEDLSEQWLLSCNTADYGCDGGWWAHNWHAGRTGICGGTGAVYENDFEYAASKIPCSGPYTHVFLLKDWAHVGSTHGVPSVSSIKQAIYDYGPVSAAVYVDELFQLYNSSIFDSSNNGRVNHAIVLVGWKDDESVTNGGYWILRNSWGDGWGENGYMKIAYNTHSVGYSACYVGDYTRQGSGDEKVRLDVKTLTNSGSEFEPIDPIGFREPEWYYKLSIGSDFNEENHNIKPDTDGFWQTDYISEFTWNINEGHLVNVEDSTVSVKIDAYDSDFGDTDDHADISPKPGRSFKGNYNLVSDELTFDDDSSVNIENGFYRINGNQDDNARFIFSISDSYHGEAYQPELGVSPSNLDFGEKEDGTHSDIFKVVNKAANDPKGWADNLDWSASSNKNWITINKNSGSLEGGRSDDVTVTVDASDLSKGTHSGEITVSSNDGTKKVSVEINIKEQSKEKNNVLDFDWIVSFFPNLKEIFQKFNL